MFTETKYKEFYKAARIVAVGGSILLIAWASRAHSIELDMHSPTGEHDMIERAYEEKIAKDAIDKLKDGGSLSLFEWKCVVEYKYRNDYVDLTRHNQNDRHSDNHSDNHSDRLMESRDNNDRGGNGTYDRE